MAKQQESICNDILYNYKLVFWMDKITLEEKESVDCKILFKYDFFRGNEMEFPSFTIKSGVKKSIGLQEFNIARQKESDIKKFFLDNLFDISVYGLKSF